MRQVSLQAAFVTRVVPAESISDRVVALETVTVTFRELPCPPPVRCADALRMTPVMGVAVAVGVGLLPGVALPPGVAVAPGPAVGPAGAEVGLLKPRVTFRSMLLSAGPSRNRPTITIMATSARSNTYSTNP